MRLCINNATTNAAVMKINSNHANVIIPIAGKRKLCQLRQSQNIKQQVKP